MTPLSQARQAAPPASDHDAAQSRETTNRFFQLTRALCLAEAEQRALLDLSRHQMESLRSSPDMVQSAKLRRRMAYAIQLLQRMLESARAKAGSFPCQEGRDSPPDH